MTLLMITIIKCFISYHISYQSDHIIKLTKLPNTSIRRPQKFNRTVPWIRVSKWQKPFEASWRPTTVLFCSYWLSPIGMKENTLIKSHRTEAFVSSRWFQVLGIPTNFADPLHWFFWACRMVLKFKIWSYKDHRHSEHCFKLFWRHNHHSSCFYITFNKQ